MIIRKGQSSIEFLMTLLALLAGTAIIWSYSLGYDQNTITHDLVVKEVGHEVSLLGRVVASDIEKVLPYGQGAQYQDVIYLGAIARSDSVQKVFGNNAELYLTIYNGQVIVAIGGDNEAVLVDAYPISRSSTYTNIIPKIHLTFGSFSADFVRIPLANNPGFIKLKIVVDGQELIVYDGANNVLEIHLKG